jgi:hypothetical protein
MHASCWRGISDLMLNIPSKTDVHPNYVHINIKFLHHREHSRSLLQRPSEWCCLKKINRYLPLKIIRTHICMMWYNSKIFFCYSGWYMVTTKLQTVNHILHFTQYFHLFALSQSDISPSLTFSPHNFAGTSGYLLRSKRLRTTLKWQLVLIWKAFTNTACDVLLWQA